VEGITGLGRAVRLEIVGNDLVVAPRAAGKNSAHRNRGTQRTWRSRIRATSSRQNTASPYSTMITGQEVRWIMSLQTRDATSSRAAMAARSVRGG
jgi:hypothetical protein